MTRGQSSVSRTDAADLGCTRLHAHARTTCPNVRIHRSRSRDARQAMNREATLARVDLDLARGPWHTARSMPRRPRVPALTPVPAPVPAPVPPGGVGRGADPDGAAGGPGEAGCAAGTLADARANSASEAGSNDPGPPAAPSETPTAPGAPAPVPGPDDPTTPIDVPDTGLDRLSPVVASDLGKSPDPVSVDATLRRPPGVPAPPGRRRPRTVPDPDDTPPEDRPGTIGAALATLEAAFQHVRGVPSEVVDDAILATGAAPDLASARRLYGAVLARAQLSDAEVGARVAEASFADLYPWPEGLDKAATLNARLLGRGDLRLRAFRAAVGEIALDKDQWAALKEVAFQVAGWTREGYDLHVRAVAEGGERRVALSVVQ